MTLALERSLVDQGGIGLSHSPSGGGLLPTTTRYQELKIQGGLPSLAGVWGCPPDSQYTPRSLSI